MINTGCELRPAPNGYWETDGPKEEPMTVADLIEILKTHDPKAHILLTGYEYGYVWARQGLIVPGNYKIGKPPFSVITEAEKNDPYYGIDYGPHSGRLKPQKDGTPCVFISRYEVDYD